MKFQEILQSHFDQHCPKKNSFIRNNNKKNIKLTENMKLHRSLMDEAYKTFKHSGMTKFEEKYKYHRHQFITDVRLKKKKQCTESLKKASNKSKCAWKMADEIVDREGRKKIASLLTCEITLKREDNTTIVEPFEVANTLNEYFTSVGDHNDNRTSTGTPNFLEDLNTPLINKRFTLETVNSNSINKIIAKLPNKTSAGHDEVSCKLIKSCQNVLIKPLTLLINDSIVSGTFPKCLKHSNVVPIYKKKEASNKWIAID